MHIIQLNKKKESERKHDYNKYTNNRHSYSFFEIRIYFVTLSSFVK